MSNYTIRDAELIVRGDHPDFTSDPVHELDCGSGRWLHYWHKVFRHGTTGEHWAIQVGEPLTEMQERQINVAPYRVEPYDVVMPAVIKTFWHPLGEVPDRDPPTVIRPRRSFRSTFVEAKAVEEVVITVYDGPTIYEFAIRWQVFAEEFGLPSAPRVEMFDHSWRAFVSCSDLFAWLATASRKIGDVTPMQVCAKLVELGFFERVQVEADGSIV
jgi:hypothetical protein